MVPPIPNKSIAAGKQVVLKEVDINRADELEGFTFTGSSSKGIAVTSSKADNVNFMDISW